MKTVIEQLLFHGMWQNSLDSMFLIRVRDDDFYIEGINHVLEDFIGAKSADLQGTRLIDLLPAPDTVLSHYRDCLQSGRTIYYEEEGIAPDGSSKFWHTMLVPLEYEGKDFLFGSSRDITDLKETERRLEYARDEAEAANAAKTLFLANMSHELRTPLNGIMGTASLLRQKQKESAETTGQLDLIVRSADAMNRLVEDILDLSKIENNSLRITPSLGDLRPTLDDVVILMRDLAEEKGLDFRYQLAEKFPVRLLADEARIRQILTNLLSNAVKFTEQGFIRLEVTYKESGEADSEHHGALRILVEDSGIGIAPDKLNQIGTPFFQVHPERNRRHTGSGIGLSVCKSLVELMHGDFRMRSEPSVGTLAEVILPTQTTALEEEVPAPPEFVPPTPFSVLVAEDNNTNQLIMRRMLQHLGAEVTLASDGHEALELARKKPFALVLMDLHMPSLDGIAATHALRAEGFDVPVVAVTASVTQQEREACKRARMNSFVDKPVKVEALRNMLARIFPA
ncbi:MAG: response regulator [Natronospirillum sp.]|uniref:ATP-binding protein n=1 Tax=Natronospirillum sp. TaxID=2812955 RepID=UPI0025D19F6B|nr:ATP-binding protein [Natronospirillum sp.]MCH8550512.1 response regulator [Natronospirillum sp.]